MVAELLSMAQAGLITENLYAIFLMGLGYTLLCIVIPVLCLRWRVVEKPLGYRLVYYQMCGMGYIVLISFILAYTHLYSAVSIWLLLVILPLGARAFYGRKGIKAWFLNLVSFSRNFSKGEYNSLRIRKSLATWIAKRAEWLYETYLHGHLFSYVAWIIFLAFIVLFYGYFKLHYSSYAMTDEETHLYWIQSLLANSAFPAGLYPHGEHFLVGAIVTIFGVQVARNWLVFSLISTISIFELAYLFFRRVFSSRAGVLLAMGIFLFLDTTFITTYYRYQYCVPMEFALGPMFIMFYGLVDYMHTKERQPLLIFGGGLALSFQAHFYVTIFALILIVGYALVLAWPALKQKIFHKIFICALASLLISAAPFGVGLLCGYSFERSINWAVEIAQGGDGTASLNGTTTETEEAEVTEEEEEEVSESDQLIIDTKAQFSAIRTPLDAYNFLAYLLQLAFSSSLTAARVVSGLAFLTLIYGALGTLWCFIRKSDSICRYQIYLAYAVSWFLGAFVYGMSYLGFPQIIHVTRAAIFLNVYTIGLYAMPLQILHNALSRIPVKEGRIDAVLCILAALGLFGICQVAPTKTLTTLYYNFAIQNADMRICEKIMDEEEDFTWTVVSPVNDLSAIRRNGYHYEIVDLMEEIETGKSEIYIPTPDVYVVVESPVVSYGYSDSRMVDGSDFLDKTIPISAHYAVPTFEELGLDQLASRDRAYYDIRPYTMSKLYYWMQKILEVYPSETSVYYQDDYCTVYRIHQDPYFLLNLSVDYSDVVEKALAEEQLEAQQ